MRKLSDDEVKVCRFIHVLGGFTPAVHGQHVVVETKDILDSLVRKKRAYVEDTDLGPKYHLTAQGMTDAI